ncbi:MAG: DUF2057 family protein [Vibrio sp.]|uniref:DUF2057 family protein n=1 Tax=Vibrio sp. TaxID=678 RepID=UPI003F3FBA13
MKNWPNWWLAVAACLPFSATAAVEVKLAADISAIVVNGEESGFRINKLSNLTLDDGTQQLVVRVSKLVSSQGGYEKFNSNPLVLTFSATNQRLALDIGQPITTAAQAQAFDAAPQLSLTEISSGKTIEILQAELPRLQGISRDYVKELNAYNKQHNLMPVAQTVTLPAAQATTAAATVATQASTPTTLTMVQYLYSEATSAEQQEFANWAFANRATVSEPLVSHNKLVTMMADWYQKADKADKAAILAWLISQE